MRKSAINNCSFDVKEPLESSDYRDFNLEHKTQPNMCGTENINNDLYEKTNELNKLNFQIVQLNECKVMLEKELKEIKCGPNDFQKKIKENQEKIRFLEEELSDLQENKDNYIKKQILEEKEEEYSGIESQLNELKMQATQEQSLMSGLQKEFSNQKQMFKSNLSELQEKKNSINQELTQKIEKLNQLLEKKAMTKEELNGKLLQRAEAIAQREEYEQILDDSSISSEFQEIYENLKKLTISSKKTTEEKQVIFEEKTLKTSIYTQITSELSENNEKTFDFKSKLNKLIIDKQERLSSNREKNEKIEENLYLEANRLKIPEIESFFDFLSKKHEYFLEKAVLSKQMCVIEEEERKLHVFLKNDDFLQKNENFLKKKSERLIEIERWKNEVKGYLGKEKEDYGGNLTAVYNLENFDKVLDEMTKEISIDGQEYESFKEKIFGYFEELEFQDREIREIDKVERVCESNLEELEKSSESLRIQEQSTKSSLDQIESLYSEAVLKYQLIENERKTCEKLLENMIFKQAEQTFSSYMTEQSATFNNIARTYGKNTAATLEKQHHNQFMNIYKNNQIEKMEKYYQVKEDCDKLEYIITYNMRTVDDVIIPSLKEIILKINELKKTLTNIQNRQVNLIDEEDNLMNDLNQLQMQFRFKIRSIYENQESDKDKREAELCYLQIKLEDLKTEIDKNFQDINRDIEYDDEEDMDEKIEQIKQTLIITNEELYKYQVLFQKYQEKSSQFDLIKEKLTKSIKRKNFLEKHINLILCDENSTEYPMRSLENNENRSKSVMKTRESQSIPMNKVTNTSCLTERVNITDEMGLQKLKNAINGNNKTKKNRHERCISQDLTIKKQNLLNNSILPEVTNDEGIKSKPILQCKNNKECMRHQKSYKFNLENATTKEIELFESIKPLLEGIIIYKKFTNYQSLKQPTFNPMTSEHLPENCGYGLRMVTLNIFLEKLEFKSQAKIIESSIKIEQIFKSQIPQITIDMIKSQKKTENCLNSWETEFLKNNKKNKVLTEKTQNKEKHWFPFCLILEEGGRIELIARNNLDLSNFVGGVNALLQLRREMGTLKNKIEVTCN